MPDITKNGFSGRSQMRTSVAKKLTIKEKNMLIEEIQKKEKSGEIFEKKVPDGFLLNLISSDLSNRLVSPELEELYDMLFLPNPIVLPEVFNCMFGFLDPFATKKQAIEGMDVTASYLKSQLKSVYWTTEHKNHFLSLYNILHNAREVLSKMDENKFGDGSNWTLQAKLFIASRINDNLIANPKRPPIKVVKAVLKECFPETDFNHIGQKHISNVHKVKRDHGGEPKVTFQTLSKSISDQNILKSPKMPEDSLD